MNIQFLENTETKKFLIQFKSFLKQHFAKNSGSTFKGTQKLKQAMEYSVFSEGKYFRPLLVFATSQLLSIKTSSILPWAGAIEIIHVASLIHDDLPCMDNSLERRKKASNHRRFGENMALLAGDCLWIEAFRMLHLYGNNQQVNMWLPILCKAGGFDGLMGGQALDLTPSVTPNQSYYKKMHSMKTGAIISAAITGVLALKPAENTDSIKKASYLIGQAFQLCDDLQDTEDTSNFVTLLGQKKAKKQLHQLSNKALELISSYKKSPTTTDKLLKDLILFNYERSKQ